METAGDAAGQKRLWAARKSISAAVATVMIGKVNEDVVVPRDRIAELVATVRRLGADHSVPVVNFGHLGDGNLHATFLIDPRRPGDRQRGDAAAAGLFETVLDMGGAITGEHGVGSTKLPYVERQLGPGTVELMRRIKASLDPRGLLNPMTKVPPRNGASVESR
jgi:FAD/FMN-containing dehydrogenase